MKKIISLGLLALCSAIAFAQDPKDPASRLLAAEGKVEVARAGQAAWRAGATNQVLQNGDRIRTGVRSRATIRLSDLSVLVVKELTTLGFFTTEAGATKLLRYDATPGPYRGDIPLSQVGREWAT